MTARGGCGSSRLNGRPVEMAFAGRECHHEPYAIRMRLAWPLTGRSEEMRLIDAALETPGQSGVVVCGVPGVGKSRLAREVLSRAAPRGWETRWAVGTNSARTLPLGAFADWAEPVRGDNLQLVRGVIESLTAAAPGVRVVIGIDDVNVLDDLSVFVLQQIVQREAARLVLTVRHWEPVPEAVREIWQGGQFERLDLQPLSRAESAVLVSAALGGRLDPDAAGRLWKLTRGNPLYLRNIVEPGVSDGRLVQRHGYWTWTGEPKVSPGLLELIESRIGTLPGAVGDVLDTLAVGEPIELASLIRLTDRAAVEDADNRGLITLERADGGMEVRIAHPLYGEVRRNRAAPIRLRRLRGLVAAELAADHEREDMRIVVRRAALTVDSDLEPDPDLLVRAAQGAVWLGDLPLADRLAGAAIRAGGGAEANFVRAHALSWLSRGSEADAVLVDIPAAEFSDENRARLAFLRACNMLWTLADPVRAKQHIDDASRATPSPACAAIDAFRTVYWAASGNPAEAAAVSKDLVPEALPAVVGAVTSWAIAVAAGDAGRAAEATANAHMGYRIATRAFDAAHMRFVIADAHVGALLLSGQIHAAGEAAEMIRRQAVDQPGAAQSFGAALAGRAALGAGRLDNACALLVPVVDLLRAVDETNGFSYRYQLSCTQALAMRGSAEAATDALDALEQLRHPSWRYLDYEYGLAHAWVSATQGAVTEAIRASLSAAETARNNGQFAAEVYCRQTAAQFGDHSSAPRLAELANQVEGPRAGIVARFAMALHRDDGPELAAAAQEFERIGDLVAAADAAAHAAMAYRRKDMRGSALGCVTRADELAAECGGAVTPALLQAAEPLPLTTREREIVMLIGAGLSSRAVADRLCLSVRTVEGHIYRAMGKTGVTSRDELAALLPRQRSVASR
jgi:DNA-binding CsgD family transcriptional regulator